MKAPEELTAEANDEITKNIRWELSLVGLNIGEINQQVDALIEDNYQLKRQRIQLIGNRNQIRDGGVCDLSIRMTK
jgi:hypothetical protein